MGRWALGFEVPEKSFELVRKNKSALWYLIVSALSLAVSIFLFLYFKCAERLVLPFSDDSNKPVLFLAIVFAVPLIYMVLRSMDIKLHFTIITFFSIVAWVLIAAGFYYMVDIYYLRNAHEVWLLNVLKVLINFIWGTITYYILSIIVLEGIDPLRAIIKSIKAIKHTWVEALAFEIWFAILAFFIMLPFIIGGVALYYLKSEAISNLLLPTLTIPLGCVLFFIKMVGRTLLYLYYKKELPASYFAK